MLEELKNYQRKLFAKHIFDYKRYFYSKINLDKKLVGIIGARGVGKTTFLLQYLNSLEIPFTQKLYISADIITIPSLFEVAEAFSKEEGKVLIIDEIFHPKSQDNFEKILILFSL